MPIKQSLTNLKVPYDLFFFKFSHFVFKLMEDIGQNVKFLTRVENTRNGKEFIETRKKGRVIVVELLIVLFMSESG